MRSIKNPRSLIAFILILVIVILLAGTSQAFISVRAATATAPAATASSPVDGEASLTPTPLPTPVRESADTTGIIALAIVIATIVLAGAILGLRKLQKKKS